MESLRFEVKPFGTIAEPFRTELLSKESTAYADLSIDYAKRTAQTRPAREAINSKQAHDPAKFICVNGAGGASPEMTS